MAEYRLSPAAEFDLEGIWKYTRQEWGLVQAERYVGRLKQFFVELNFSGIDNELLGSRIAAGRM